MTGAGDAAWQANFDIDLMSTVRSVEAAASTISRRKGAGHASPDKMVVKSEELP